MAKCNQVSKPRQVLGKSISISRVVKRTVWGCEDPLEPITDSKTQHFSLNSFVCA